MRIDVFDGAKRPNGFIVIKGINQAQPLVEQPLRLKGRGRDRVMMIAQPLERNKLLFLRRVLGRQRSDKRHQDQAECGKPGGRAM